MLVRNFVKHLMKSDPDIQVVFLVLDQLFKCNYAGRQRFVGLLADFLHYVVDISMDDGVIFR